MKAAYIENGKVCVGEMPDPVPAQGQALVRTHSCGMCASEQHFLHSGQNVIDLSRKHGGPYAALDFARPFVPGHEYVGEIIDYGPGSKRPVKVGRRVTSVPVMRHAGGHAVIGFSHECPGGWGELMLLDENALIEIPDGLDDDPDLVAVCGYWTEDEGAQALRGLLDRSVEFSAVVAGNDLIALGCYDVFAERGIVCPDEVSVVGFNDMPFLDKLRPPLTTLSVPHHQVGVEAARMLLEAIDEPDRAARSVLLPLSLKVRGSTAPPPPGA